MSASLRGGPVHLSCVGVIGGILLDLTGSGSFPWSVLLLLLPVLAVILLAHNNGFPTERPQARGSDATD